MYQILYDKYCIKIDVIFLFDQLKKFKAKQIIVRVINWETDGLFDW